MNPLANANSCLTASTQITEVMKTFSFVNPAQAPLFIFSTKLAHVHGKGPNRITRNGECAPAGVARPGSGRNSAAPLCPRLSASRRSRANSAVAGPSSASGAMHTLSPSTLNPAASMTCGTCRAQVIVFLISPSNPEPWHLHDSRARQIGEMRMLRGFRLLTPFPCTASSSPLKFSNKPLSPSVSYQ